MNRRWVAMGLLLAASACSHHGPDWGVSGHVRLEDGSALAGITIRIDWPDLGGSRTVLTDAAGRYYHDWESGVFLSNEAQEHVIVTPVSSEYSFTPAAMELRLPGVVYDLDFVAHPLDAAVELGWWLRWSDGQVQVVRPVVLRRI